MLLFCVHFDCLSRQFLPPPNAKAAIARTAEPHDANARAKILVALSLLFAFSGIKEVAVTVDS